MKRIMTIALILIFAVGAVAQASDIDWASMSDKDIMFAIGAAQAELNKRGTGNAQSEDAGQGSGNQRILDFNGLTVDVTGYSVDNDSWLYTDGALVIDVIIENNSSKDYTVSMDAPSINGWQVDSSVYTEIAVGKKQKDQFKLDLGDANISSIEEIEEIEFRWNIYDSSYMSENVPPVTVRFK